MLFANAYFGILYIFNAQKENSALFTKEKACSFVRLLSKWKLNNCFVHVSLACCKVAFSFFFEKQTCTFFECLLKPEIKRFLISHGFLLFKEATNFWYFY